MYTKEQLSKYSYFNKILQEHDVSRVVDSLTGLISRAYMIGFIQQLIEDEVPFTLAMLDLDNFKFINDNYGHKIGDGVLTAVSSDLFHYLEDYGIAGRFGGDEFLIINFRDTEYDSVKGFFNKMYTCYTLLRKNISLENCEPFITGTIGSATYPKDAKNYETMFDLIDKALYRGKTKGRNCYIIYTETKHKNIQIKELARRGIYSTLHNLATQFDTMPLIVEKLKYMFNILQRDLKISDLYYVGEDNIFKGVIHDSLDMKVFDLDTLTLDGLYMSNEIELIREKSPSLYQVCIEQEFETLLMVEIRMEQIVYGYLICAEPRNLRIWQDDESAILFVVARMLAEYIKGSGQKL